MINRTAKQLQLLSALTISVVLAVVLLTSCDAPRNNPLDPQNPSYSYGEAGGVVYTVSVPRKPLEGVQIFLNGTLLAVTDASGYFSVKGIEKSTAKLLAVKTGYNSDSLTLTWGGAKKLAVEFFLNQQPVVDSVALYVTSVSRYTLPALHQIAARVKLSDKDNDIDSVFIVCPSLGIKKQMTYNVTDKKYEKDIPSYDLSVPEIESVVGVSFSVEVTDLAGRHYTFPADDIKRIIRQPIQSTSPANGDTVSSPVRLNWQEYSGLFPYKQLVQVYSNDLDVNPVLVWEKDNFSSDSTAVTVDKTLPSGSYFWVIWCVDQYSDRMRSNPASFNIK